MSALPADVDWIDALTPSTDEIALVERWLKVSLPTKDELAEVETSSRMSVVGAAVFLSMPATVRNADGYPTTTPIGFVVFETVVATIRFEHLPSFEKLAKRIADEGGMLPGGPGATVSILELVVDQLADTLEQAGAELDGVSRRVFSGGLGNAERSAPRRSNRALAELMRTVGKEADLISKVSQSLLVLSRIAPFLSARALPTVPSDLKARLETVVSDATSLREFQDHLSDKSAFLLDALLGLSNIEQNNVFRVLTVVSVVGIPPTFFASMYGMNFKGMPEYDWPHGYAYGLTLIACSAVIPAIWFKVKGWW
jgi:magnesium transporter